MNGDIENGDSVEDTVTGFTGTVTAIATYLVGTTRCQVTTTVKDDGKFVEEWFDMPRLSKV